MRCLSCGQDNSPEARFCANCGAALVTPVEPPSPVAEPTPPSEPAVVTVEPAGFWSKYKRIIRFALFGAIGFGIGGIIIGMGLSVSLVVGGIGFAAMGALGGASLGLALRRKVATLALLGAIGFLTGILAGFFIGEELGGENLGLAIFLAFAVTGMIGGAALGLALRNWRKIIGLALAGALGFGIGMMILMFIPHVLIFIPLEFEFNIFAVMVHFSGIPGGALIGATLGYLEKEREREIPLKENKLLISGLTILIILGIGFGLTFLPREPIETLPTDTTPVTFPDSSLEAAIREVIRQPEGLIYMSRIEHITVLIAQERGISDLTGLEYCVNLERLDLGPNSISDISPLENLTSLNALGLGGNQISDISALVENSGLGAGDRVRLENNNLDLGEGSEDMDNVRALEDRGVVVRCE